MSVQEALNFRPDIKSGDTVGKVLDRAYQKSKEKR